MIKQSDVLILGDPRLKQKAKSVEDPSSCVGLIDRMLRIMHAYEGLGLAATQIGEMVRVFVWKIGESEGGVINPVLTFGEEIANGVEGCLSIPGMTGEVPRRETIDIQGFDKNGKPLRMAVSGLQARVFQHEVDHLDGILFIERAVPGTLKPVPMNQAPSI